MLSGRGGLARVRMIIPAIVVQMNVAGGVNFYNFSTSLSLQWVENLPKDSVVISSPCVPIVSISC